MKKLVAGVFLAFAISQVNAQQVNIDSLARAAISKSKNSKSLQVPNRDSLLNLWPSIKLTADRTRVIYDIIYNYGQLSPAKTLDYENKLLSFARTISDLANQAVIMSESGDILYDSGKNTEGLAREFNALKLAEQSGNKQAMGIVYENLAFCYPDNFNLNKLYNQKALQYSIAAGDNLSVCWELINLSYNYKSQHQVDSARYYLLKSFKLSVSKNVEQAIPRNLTDVAALQTDPAIRLKYYKAALNTPYAKCDLVTKGFIMGNIALYYQTLGATDSGLYYAKKAYAAASEFSITRKIMPVRILSQLYIGHNADSALKYTKVYYAIRDSMHSLDKMKRAQDFAFADQQRRQEIEKQKVIYRDNLRLYGLIAIIVFLVIMALFFWRNNRNKQKANLALRTQKEQLQKTLQDLKLTQQQLIQSEKMASLGELTAGIAHEIKNPLNFVNNFAEVNMDLLEEMQLEIKNGDSTEALAIAADIYQNMDKIKLHGARADGIVKSMLEHSRSGGGIKEPADLNKLTDEFLKLSYHGLRAKDRTFNVEIETNFDPKLPTISVMAQDIGRVLLNIINNAFYAVQQKQKQKGSSYKPLVKVATALKGNFVEVRVWDNGIGIPDAIKEKIMQPFFTTKPSGEGTGLGLSLSYDIVTKMHKGHIEVESKQGEYSEFKIALPV